MPDGLRRNAAGEPLRIELMTTAGNRTRELIQQVAQGQWRQLGIETVIRNEPARVFFGETTTKRRFTGLALFAWISSPENVPRTTLHSQEIPSEANGWSGQNFTGYRNPRMDELLDAIEVELDREKRAGLWHELQRIYAEELPALPLFFRADAHIWPKWLQGVAPTGHMAPVTLWVEQWRVGESRTVMGNRRRVARLPQRMTLAASHGVTQVYLTAAGISIHLRCAGFGCIIEGTSRRVLQVRSVCEQDSRSRKLRCFAVGSNGAWEAICLDLDVAAQGNSFEEADQCLRRAIDLYLEHVATLPMHERGRFLHRRVPLVVRLRFAVEAFLLALATHARSGYQHHYTVPFPA